jgi:hypothetical protein
MTTKAGRGECSTRGSWAERPEPRSYEAQTELPGYFQGPGLETYTVICRRNEGNSGVAQAAASTYAEYTVMMEWHRRQLCYGGAGNL